MKGEVAAPRVADYPCASDAGGEPSLTTLARTFLRLGLTAFGGPAAHIALFREEVAPVRAWPGRGIVVLTALAAAALLALDRKSVV